MDKFEVLDAIEHRSDDEKYAGYGGKLNNQSFLIYYYGDQVKEVYLGDDRYFMSCRPDMKTISHYYNDGKIIKRYENGVLNRIYYQKDNDTWYVENNKKVVYHLDMNVKVSDHMKNKIYKDFTQFLEKFNQLKLYELFQPQEPQN